MNTLYPPTNKPRRRKKNKMGCACDGNYAKSLQGICKIISLLVGLLTFIIVGASPYWRVIFVLEGVTWPFHIVMLLTILVWLATAFMYFFFLSGQHLEYPHIAWPTVELRFNVAMVIVVFFDALLEATNVWRWDMSRGFSMTGSGNAGGSLTSFGYSPGMTFSQSINMNSYCSRYPRDCQDYFSLLTGNNSYYGNHIFATILLFILLICYLVSAFFSFRTWKVFKRDMTKGADDGKLPQPSAWDRFRYRISEIKVPRVTATNIRERFNKIVNRNDVPDAESDGHNIDFDPTDIEGLTKYPPSPHHEEEVGRRSEHASSVYSSGHKSSRSHHSSHHGRSSDRRSRSSSNSRRHRHERHGEDRRSEKSHKSSRSPRSDVSPRSSHQRGTTANEDGNTKETQPLVVDMKAIGKEPLSDEHGPTSPVASVMC